MSERPIYAILQYYFVDASGDVVGCSDASPLERVFSLCSCRKQHVITSITLPPPPKEAF